MKMDTKYDIGDLVEYKQDRNDECNRFGHIAEIIVYKPTASTAVRYNINPVNHRIRDEGEPLIDRDIYETNIIKKYGVM